MDHKEWLKRYGSRADITSRLTHLTIALYVVQSKHISVGMQKSLQYNKPG